MPLKKRDCNWPNCRLRPWRKSRPTARTGWRCTILWTSGWRSPAAISTAPTPNSWTSCCRTAMSMRCWQSTPRSACPSMHPTMSPCICRRWPPSTRTSPSSAGPMAWTCRARPSGWSGTATCWSFPAWKTLRGPCARCTTTPATSPKPRGRRRRRGRSIAPRREPSWSKPGGSGGATYSRRHSRFWMPTACPPPLGRWLRIGNNSRNKRQPSAIRWRRK